MIRRLIGGDRRKEKAVTEMSPESSGQHRTIPFLKRWNAEKNSDCGSVSPTPCSSPARLPPRPQSLDLASFRVVKVSLHGHRIEEQLNQLEHEIAMLSEFQHENIVQYLGSDKEDNKLYIFLELVTQKSLASLYRKYHLRDSQVSVYARQILNGLKYLHDKGVMHRDIKCANILVDANGMVKLADFGLAKQVDKLQMLSSCKGSAYWMAPEVVHPRKSYGLPADIWSFGCTVLEMLTGQVPYAHLEPTAAIFKIGRGEPPSIPRYLSRNARHFIKVCLQVDPDRRPTAADLLEHPFVRSTSTASCPQNEEGQISCQLFPLSEEVASTFWRAFVCMNQQ